MLVKIKKGLNVSFNYELDSGLWSSVEGAAIQIVLTTLYPETKWTTYGHNEIDITLYRNLHGSSSLDFSTNIKYRNIKIAPFKSDATDKQKVEEMKKNLQTAVNYYKKKINKAMTDIKRRIKATQKAVNKIKAMSEETLTFPLLYNKVKKSITIGRDVYVDTEKCTAELYNKIGPNHGFFTLLRDAIKHKYDLDAAVFIENKPSSYHLNMIVQDERYGKHKNKVYKLSTLYTCELWNKEPKLVDAAKIIQKNFINILNDVGKKIKYHKIQKEKKQSKKETTSYFSVEIDV